MRVMTWNLWWRFGPWAARQPAIRATLADVAPDVCGLQEVWSTVEQNQAAELAAQLGMHHAWSRSEPGPRFAERAGHVGVDIGLGLLSRWPILAVEELTLTATPHVDRRTRTVLHAVLDAPGGTVPVFTTHLPSAPWASAERCTHVRELAAFVADRSRGHHHRPIVLGDLNAVEDADEIRLLCGHKTAPVVPGMSMVDAWAYAGPGTGGETLSGANPHSPAHPAFGVRIDYVLLGYGRELGRHGRIGHVEVVGHEPVEGMVPSDHYAVVVDLL